MFSLKPVTLTIFQGRAGDHNDLAIPGASSVGTALSEQLGLPGIIIGTPEYAINADWKTELAAAMPALKAMSAHYATIFEKGSVPLTVLTRCAVALATLPVVARYRPDACVVWLDAHADINTPETSTTGYLGGMAISGSAGLWLSELGNDLDPSHVILTGLRDVDHAEKSLIDTHRVQTVPPGPDLAARLKQAIAGRPIYIHLDCDVLDPGIVPTDYRIENGLSLSDLRAAADIMAEEDIVGFEIAEFQSVWDVDGPSVSPRHLLDAVRPLTERLLRKS